MAVAQILNQFVANDVFWNFENGGLYVVYNVRTDLLTLESEGFKLFTICFLLKVSPMNDVIKFLEPV